MITILMWLMTGVTVVLGIVMVIYMLASEVKDFKTKNAVLSLLFFLICWAITFWHQVFLTMHNQNF